MTEFPALMWIDTLYRATNATIATAPFDPVSLDKGVNMLRNSIRDRTDWGSRVYLIGNGGSLAVASHIATDFALFANWPSIALTNSVALTSHTNDYGADANFTKQLELLRSREDVLIAMSCSGKSRNIIDAAQYVEASGGFVATFTGFEPDNSLRRLGALNFYVPAHEYGFVQLAHESILHATCDIENGWGP